MAVSRQAVRRSTAVVGIGVSSDPDRRVIRVRIQHVTGKPVAPLHFGIEWQQSVTLGGSSAKCFKNRQRTDTKVL
jgi:hypothetical protein